ncbi:MAG: transglutaminase domain-containing protein [candidate division WOR-3 bacterium]
MKRIILFSTWFLFFFCQKGQTLREDETWLGFYLNGKKVGYSFQKFQIGPKNFRFYNRAKMRLAMAGSVQELLTTTDCTTNPDFSIQGLRFDLIAPKQKVRINALVKENELYQEVFTEKGPRRTKISLEDKIYPSFALGKIVHQKKLTPNKDYNFHIFEPILNKILLATVTVLGKEEVKIGDSTYLCTKAKVVMANNTSFYWIDTLGREIKEETPPQMLAIRESPQEALSQEKGEEAIDIISYFSIKVDTVIPKAQGLEYLKIQITGIKHSDFDLNLAEQKVISEDPLILEIRYPHLQEKPIPLPINQQKEFLKPSLYIQSDDRDIINKAKEVKGGKEDAQEVAKKILFWVYEHLRKVPTASLPSAVDVLKSKEGDCNEHSILFAALCRAAGIPAKICVGLVYFQGSFYYHAWNLVYLDRWVPCDPTFGEFPANPTHIILKVGEIEEQAKVLNAVGKIKIKVLEFN